MISTGLKFEWESGNKNDTAKKAFKKHGIDYRYSKYGELEADLFGINLWMKIQFVHLHDDVFGICA